MAVIDKDMLEHHGILGQKWGSKHGPPYPLEPSKDYTKAELKGMRKQAKQDAKKAKKKKKQEDEEEKKQKTEEELKLEKEEAKKKAIKSGSVSEVEKYKDDMTNEELQEAMDRIRINQEFGSLKIKDLKQSNERMQEELTKIEKENKIREQKLVDKYGPGKGEAALEKTARITKKLGEIATDVGKGRDLYYKIKTFTGDIEKAEAQVKTSKETARKIKADADKSRAEANKAIAGLKGLAKEKTTEAKTDAINVKAANKAKKKARKEIKKVKGYYSKQKETFKKSMQTKKAQDAINDMRKRLDDLIDERTNMKIKDMNTRVETVNNEIEQLSIRNNLKNIKLYDLYE